MLGPTTYDRYAVSLDRSRLTYSLVIPTPLQSLSKSANLEVDEGMGDEVSPHKDVVMQLVSEMWSPMQLDVDFTLVTRGGFLDQECCGDY